MDSRTRLISLVGRVVPTVLSGVLWAVGERGRGWGRTELYNRSLVIDSVPDTIKQERETGSSREPPKEVILGTFNTYGSNQDF